MGSLAVQRPSGPAGDTTTSGNGGTTLKSWTSVLVLCADGPAAAQTPAPAITIFQNVRDLRRQEQRALPAGVRSRPREQDRADFLDGDPGRPNAGRGADRWRRAHADAGSHRRALARDAGAANAGGGPGGRHRLHEPGGGRGSDGHAVAGVHNRSRSRRTIVRAQARHRRRHRRGAAHLPVGRDDHGHGWSWRLSAAVRTASGRRRPAVPHGDARRQHGRRQSR